jgi:O-antigen ligase/polysaccharide polymerase Wzy-like membrane protein
VSGWPGRRSFVGPVTVAVPKAGPGETDAASWLTARPRGALITSAGLVVAFILGYMAIGNPHYAIALFGGAALVVLVLLRPLYGALTLVAFVPALSGLVPGIPVPNVRISEALIGVIGATLLAASRRRATVPWGFLDWLLLAYGGLWTVDGLMGALSSHQHLSVSSWGTVAGQLQFFLLYRALKVTLRTTAERHLALKILFVAGGAVALLAVLQEIKAPGIISLIATLTGSGAAGGTDGVIRATGPFANWAALAGYMLPLVLIALCFGLGGAIPQRKRALFGLGMLLTLALFVTAEFSIILCLVVGVCVLGLRYGRGRVVLRWLGIGAVVVAIGAGGLLAQRLDAQLSSSAGSNRHAGVPQTLNTRWSIWTQQYIPAIEQKPLTGYGVELPSSVRWPYPESQYIAFLIEGGLPLLAVFGFLAWAMMDEARRAARSEDPIDRALGEALRVSVLAMVVVNAIWPFLSNGGMPQLLWCLFALVPPVIERTTQPPVEATEMVRQSW